MEKAERESEYRGIGQETGNRVIEQTTHWKKLKDRQSIEE
jgi:hypothetical protein